MKDHQVIIGTRHDATCALPLAETVAAIFTRHGFEVHDNVSGYTGGNIVATYGQPETRRVHALQLEINASLLMTTEPRGVHRPHLARRHPGQGRGQHRPRAVLPAGSAGGPARGAGRRAPTAVSLGVAPSPAPGPIFQVEHLSLAYPGRRGQPPAQILTDVSVAVERGGALTLVGPSGSGKSSLLRCLNRLEEPTGGTVVFDGRAFTEWDPRELRRRAALVLQTPVLFEGTVRDNLSLRAMKVALDCSEGRLCETLAEVGLEAGVLDREAATLSGGEKQRVTIARALLREPQALLLDEPTSALDPPNATLVVETVCRLRRARGLTVVVVTHSPELVRQLGGALLYLVKGRVQSYERLDGDPSGAIADQRLQAFLAGVHP